MSSWLGQAPSPAGCTQSCHSPAVLCTGLCRGRSLSVAVWFCPGLIPPLFLPLPPGNVPQHRVLWGPHQVWGASGAGRDGSPWTSPNGLAGQAPLWEAAYPHRPSLYKWDRCQEGREVFEVTQSRQL